jgi:hypothetical protein
LAHKGSLPTVDELSAWAKVTREQAKDAIKNYQPDLGPVAPARQQVVTKPVTVERTKTSWHWRNALDFLMDSGSLLVAIVIDLVLNIVVFYTIAPDGVTRVGMISLAFVVVLFGLRSWMKGWKTLWAMFALITAFSDLSFALAVTDNQSATVYDPLKDRELLRLQRKVQDDSNYLQELRAKQVEQGAGYKAQVEAAVEQSNKSAGELSVYTLRRASEPRNSEMGISSSKVFTAIPTAVLSSDVARWLALVFFTLIFVGLQLTIVSSASKVKAE